MLRKSLSLIQFILLLLLKNAKCPSPRIVGGLPTSIEYYPHQVFLKIKYGTSNKLCGGSLYKENVVISAAHCFEYCSPYQVIVYPGITFLNETYKGGYQTKSIIVHERYNSIYYHYDVALVILKISVKLSNRINLIPLSSLEEQYLVGKEATVLGWGTMWEYGEISFVLRYTNLTIISSRKCRKLYYYLVCEATICATAPFGGQDACQGDSGGPLIYNNELVGIVSSGRGCGRRGFPGLYTKISAIKQWIEKMTSNENID